MVRALGLSFRRVVLSVSQIILASPPVLFLCALCVCVCVCLDSVHGRCKNGVLCSSHETVDSGNVVVWRRLVESVFCGSVELTRSRSRDFATAEIFVSALRRHKKKAALKHCTNDKGKCHVLSA